MIKKIGLLIYSSIRPSITQEGKVIYLMCLNIHNVKLTIFYKHKLQTDVMISISYLLSAIIYPFHKSIVKAWEDMMLTGVQYSTIG